MDAGVYRLTDGVFCSVLAAGELVSETAEAVYPTVLFRRVKGEGRRGRGKGRGERGEGQGERGGERK